MLPLEEIPTLFESHLVEFMRVAESEESDSLQIASDIFRLNEVDFS